MAMSRMLRFLTRRMMVPSARTVKCIRSPVLSLAAVRTSSGMVACPLLVSVAKAMRSSFNSYIIDYCKDYRACQQVPISAMGQLPRGLTSRHREFLLSLVRAEPDWALMPFAHLQHLPALQWKLLNLRKLKSRNARRFAAQHDELAARFGSLS